MCSTGLTVVVNSLFVFVGLWSSSSLYEILNRQEKFSEKPKWLIGPRWKNLQLPALNSSAGELCMIHTGHGPKLIENIARIVKVASHCGGLDPAKGWTGEAMAQLVLSQPDFAVISRVFPFYTSWQPHHSYQFADPNVMGLEAITVNCCFVRNNREAQQQICIGSMERIRQQRQKSKNDGTTMIISNYQDKISYWCLLSFVEQQFVLQKCCLTRRNIHHLVSWFHSLQGEIILSALFEFIFYSVRKQSPWIWVNPSSGGHHEIWMNPKKNKLQQACNKPLFFLLNLC